jgi:ubiquinone biosynthesis protein COQ4
MDAIMANTSSRRLFRPLEAIRAVRALLADPDDTAQVFRVIRALRGRTFERLYRRTLADPVGGRILRERRRLLPTLSNREALLALPEDTLGHAYARFMETEQLSAGGLVEASESDDRLQPISPEAEVLGERLRDMHDLWHVVTGYGRDLLGEAALLAFTYAQTRNRGVGVIVGVALYKLYRARAHQGVALIRGAYRRGRKAALLPAADWEELLELPLDEVRRRLRVEPAQTYVSVRSKGAPALAG